MPKPTDRIPIELGGAYSSIDGPDAYQADDAPSGN